MQPWKGAAFLFLYLVFSVSAVLPSRVFCERGGGRMAVEFQPFDDVCRCQECEHCLEALRGSYADNRRPAFRPCHCHHEAFDSELGHGSPRLPEAFVFPDAGITKAFEIPVPPIETRFSIPPSPSRWGRAGPDGIVSLRC